MKVLACSLTLRISRACFSMYLAVDMSIYFCYKIARGEMLYWMNVKGIIGWIVSILLRFATKTITDFTLIIQFRHSFELGGAYWSANVAINQAFCFLSVYLYHTYSDEASDEVVELLWKVVGGLFVFSMLNFGIFLLSINSGFVNTFFSSESGQQFCCNYFLEGATEEVKFAVFYHCRTYYAAIEEKLKPRLDENWDRWCEEGPDWFIPKRIKMIPSDLLPAKVLRGWAEKVGDLKVLMR